MSAKYYYLVSSLPYLHIGQKPFISGGRFLKECEASLTDKDKGIIADANINNLAPKETDPEALSAWKHFDANLRKRIADIRLLKKQGLNIHDKLHGAIKEIFEQGNPLLAEKRLCEIRWAFLECMSLKYNFDINALVIYFLKLQIINRLLVFDKEKGKAVFMQLTEVNI